MAAFALIGAVCFLVYTIVNLIRFLKWKDALPAMGTAVKEDSGGYAVAPGGNTKRYLFTVIYQAQGAQCQGTLLEKRTKRQESGIQMGKPMAIRYLPGQERVLMEEEYAKLKKGLYLYPIYCAACVALYFILVLVAASL